MWNDLDMDAKIVQVLNVQSHDPGHHFERPFLTPYQIAIRFEQQFPEDFAYIDKLKGGKGTGRHDSLAQYIALELSRGIKDHRIDDIIEGRFLYGENLRKLEYEVDGDIIESSASNLSMYRLR